MTSTSLRFHGGTAGALAPFGLFLAGVGWLAMSGAPDERGFWPVLLAALALGLALSRDRSAFAETVIESMSKPIVGLMILAWMLAGVLGTILSESGMIQALAWTAHRTGAIGAAYVGAAFVLCAVVSTATGTSFGTILVAGPLLHHAGGAMQAPAVPLMGAILAGSTFGDSISPVSDTTIASAGSQATDVAGTVRTRLRYVLPAGCIALLASVVLAAGDRVGPAAGGPSLAGSPRALPMLLAPALVVWLLARRHHLLVGLLGGIVFAVALALAQGLIPVAAILRVDRDAFGARGLIIDGMSRGVGVSVFTLLLMGLVGTLQAAGIVDRTLAFLSSLAGTARSAETAIVAAVSAAVLLTTHSVVAVLAAGPVARELGERAGLHAYRRANLLDMTVCTWPFILPWFLPTILASNASAPLAGTTMERVSPLQAGLANTYAWALVAMVALAVVTGYGRSRDDARVRKARSRTRA